MMITNNQRISTIGLFFMGLGLGLGSLMGINTALAADSIVPPQDPTQSITYWKPHTIDPAKDPAVAKAQAIFSNLLRAWNLSRIEPSLYVVQSSSGPWAASLADGNILLSRSTIEACDRFGPQRARHLLAFVLSHELAHQRADDMWHQKFFRLAGTQTPEIQSQMLRGLDYKQEHFAAIEKREAQADHDALVMMSSVGYDPYQVIDKKDFFSVWVENIWQQSCADQNGPSAGLEACRQAKSRALRARAQLSEIAAQTTLYELGIQAFIANNYQLARRYFKAYAKDYPSRAVYSSLGLSYLAQAIETHQSLIEKGAIVQPNFYYPLMIDASPKSQFADPLADKKYPNTQHRGSLDNRLKQQVHNDLLNAIIYFEKAIRLEPKHKKTYLLVALSYLLDSNTFMARGILQGKYIPLFERDPESQLLLAMTSAIEGKLDQSLTKFAEILDAYPNLNLTVLSKSLFLYTSYHNYAAVYQHQKQPEKVKHVWKALVKAAKTSGNSLLFRLALNQLQPLAKTNIPFDDHPQLRKYRLGDQIATNRKNSAPNWKTDFWLEGERFTVQRFADGTKFVLDKKNKIISAWQEGNLNQIMSAISVGDNADRSLKVFGIPSRHIHMQTGDYLAYDDYGFALHVINNTVSGWFLYDPT